MATLIFLAHRIPYPPNKGDKIRSWHFLRHLAAHHTVHLGCFIDDPADSAHIKKLEGICASVFTVQRSGMSGKIHGLCGLLNGRSITAASYASKAMGDYVRRLAGDVDAVFCFSLGMMDHAKAAAAVNNAPILFDMVDVDSAKWDKYSQISTPLMRPIYAREARILGREENDAIKCAAQTFLVSEDEASLAAQRFKGDKIITALKNGVDAQAFSPEATMPERAKACDMVFTGAMDYLPNIEAVIWFAQQVLPLVTQTYPQASFTIVGGKPDAQVLALDGKNGVAVTGFVEESRDWIAAAKLVVAPMKTARGIQNKVLEGMAMAKPCVATTDAYTGIEAPEEDGLLVRDEAQAMAALICDLLADEDRRNQLGARARRWVMDHFSWESAQAQLDEHLAKALNDRFQSEGGAE